MRILLAEDEIALAGAIVTILEKGNFSADVVHNGEDALNALEAGSYDAAVLDIMMPKLDGISVLRRLREAGNAIPILLLSAKSEIEDKVFGLDCGANDYLAKPFDARELLARLRTITRGVSTPDSKLIVGNLTLDRAGYLLS
ncbi:MAG: response regulator transcription factor, partial [Ruminococcaceae bacterium]|nr:response regulator transcription factor [Oscillospiraceae bacterium]